MKLHYFLLKKSFLNFLMISLFTCMPLFTMEIEQEAEQAITTTAFTIHQPLETLTTDLNYEIEDSASLSTQSNNNIAAIDPTHNYEFYVTERQGPNQYELGLVQEAGNTAKLTTLDIANICKQFDGLLSQSDTHHASSSNFLTEPTAREEDAMIQSISTFNKPHQNSSMLPGHIVITQNESHMTSEDWKREINAQIPPDQQGYFTQTREPEVNKELDQVFKNLDKFKYENFVKYAETVPGYEQRMLVFGISYHEKTGHSLAKDNPVVDKVWKEHVTKTFDRLSSLNNHELEQQTKYFKITSTDVQTIYQKTKIDSARYLKDRVVSLERSAKRAVTLHENTKQLSVNFAQNRQVAQTQSSQERVQAPMLASSGNKYTTDAIEKNVRDLRALRTSYSTTPHAQELRRELFTLLNESAQDASKQRNSELAQNIIKLLDLADRHLQGGNEKIAQDIIDHCLNQLTFSRNLYAQFRHTPEIRNQIIIQEYRQHHHVISHELTTQRNALITQEQALWSNILNHHTKTPNAQEHLYTISQLHETVNKHYAHLTANNRQALIGDALVGQLLTNNSFNFSQAYDVFRAAQIGERAVINTQTSQAIGQKVGEHISTPAQPLQIDQKENFLLTSENPLATTKEQELLQQDFLLTLNDVSLAREINKLTQELINQTNPVEQFVDGIRTGINDRIQQWIDHPLLTTIEAGKSCLKTALLCSLVTNPLSPVGQAAAGYFAAEAYQAIKEYLSTHSSNEIAFKTGQIVGHATVDAVTFRGLQELCTQGIPVENLPIRLQLEKSVTNNSSLNPTAPQTNNTPDFVMGYTPQGQRVVIIAAAPNATIANNQLPAPANPASSSVISRAPPTIPGATLTPSANSTTVIPTVQTTSSNKLNELKALVLNELRDLFGNNRTEHLVMVTPEGITIPVNDPGHADQQAIQDTILARSNNQATNSSGSGLSNTINENGREIILPKVETYEQARNKALEIIGEVDHNTIEPRLGKMHPPCKNKIVGSQWHGEKVIIRLDYDPVKGAHINATDYRNGKGRNGVSVAIPFEGGITEVENLLKHLNTKSNLEWARSRYDQMGNDDDKEIVEEALKNLSN